MEAVKMEKKQVIVACSHCERTFKTSVSEKDRWQDFMFMCPICNTMNCISRQELLS